MSVEFGPYKPVSEREAVPHKIPYGDASDSPFIKNKQTFIKSSTPETTFNLSVFIHNLYAHLSSKQAFPDGILVPHDGYFIFGGASISLLQNYFEYTKDFLPTVPFPPTTDVDVEMKFFGRVGAREKIFHEIVNYANTSLLMQRAIPKGAVMPDVTEVQDAADGAILDIAQCQDFGLLYLVKTESGEAFRIKMAIKIDGHTDHIFEILFMDYLFAPKFSVPLYFNNHYFCIRNQLVEFCRNIDTSLCPTVDEWEINKTMQRIYRAQIIAQLYRRATENEHDSLFGVRVVDFAKFDANRVDPRDIFKESANYKLHFRLGFVEDGDKVCKACVLVYYLGVAGMMDYLVDEAKRMCVEVDHRSLSPKYWALIYTFLQYKILNNDMIFDEDDEEDALVSEKCICTMKPVGNSDNAVLTVQDKESNEVILTQSADTKSLAEMYDLFELFCELDVKYRIP
jgi:hypothetical protein